MKKEEFQRISLSDIDSIKYSGYFIEKKKEDLEAWLRKEFSKSSEIKSLKTKKQIQSILEKFSKYFESLVEDKKYSFQFFLGDEYNYFFDLDKNQLANISKYHKTDYWLFEDLELDFWNDFYFNDKFISVYEATKNDAFQHYYFTKTKFEERDRVKPDYFREYVSKFPATLYIQSKSKILEKMEPQFEELFGKNKHEKLYNTVQEYETQKNILRLEKQFLEIEKNADKYLFGNEVIKGIQNYEIKEIYCFQEFRDKLESKMPKELFNFSWIILPKKPDNPVIGKLESYRGIFAQKYF